MASGKKSLGGKNKKYVYLFGSDRKLTEGDADMKSSVGIPSNHNLMATGSG